MWYIEHGNNYIYDCDIKGFFDNYYLYPYKAIEQNRKYGLQLISFVEHLVKKRG